MRTSLALLFVFATVTAEPILDDLTNIANDVVDSLTSDFATGTWVLATEGDTHCGNCCLETVATVGDVLLTVSSFPDPKHLQNTGSFSSAVLNVTCTSSCPSIAFSEDFSEPVNKDASIATTGRSATVDVDDNVPKLTYVQENCTVVYKMDDVSLAAFKVFNGASATKAGVIGGLVSLFAAALLV